jgi:hypothetical protein
MSKDSISQCDRGIKLALFGGTLGAAGWIFGAAFELMEAPARPAGIFLDILVVFLCAVGVLLTGFFVWRFISFRAQAEWLLRD